MAIELFKTEYGNFWLNKDDHFSNILSRTGVFGVNEIELIQSCLESGDVLLDIGAHVGLISIPITLKKNGDLKVIAFEPHEANFDLLDKNIKENNFDNSIKAVCGIVHNKKTKFAQRSIEDNTGMYSFLPSNKGAEIPSYQLDAYVEEHKINTVRAIKIDTEGAEWNVLSSAEIILEKHRPLIFCEMSMTQLRRHGHSYLEIEKLLGKQGYSFFRNFGLRDSSEPDLQIKHLSNLYDGGRFYDLIAIHQTDPVLTRFKNAPQALKKKRGLEFLKYRIHGLVILWKNRLKGE